MNDRLVGGTWSSFPVLFEVELVGQVNPQPTAIKKCHLNRNSQPWEHPVTITGSLPGSKSWAHCF